MNRGLYHFAAIALLLLSTTSTMALEGPKDLTITNISSSVQSLATGSTVFTSATVSGAVQITPQERANCVNSADYNMCLQILRTQKRAQAVTQVSLEGQPAVGDTKYFTGEIPNFEEERVIGQEGIYKFWSGLSASKEDICKEAVLLKIVKTKEKCLENIASDKMEKFEIAREIYISKVEEQLKDEKELLLKDCDKNAKGYTKKKECREKVRVDILSREKEKKKDFDIAYAVAKSKGIQIEDKYENQFKAIKLERCGRAPFDNHSSAANYEKIKYRKCANEQKEKFYSSVESERDKLIGDIHVSGQEYMNVRNYCSKGAFDFFTDKYDSCIQNTLNDNIFQEKREPLAELSPGPEIIVKEEDEINCEDLVYKEIDNLLQNDNQNILGKLYQITSLKIAKQVVQNMGAKSYPNASLESYITNQKKYYSAPEAKKVLDLYRNHGRLLDAKFIEDNIVTSGVSYHKSRLDNDKVSAFLLADVYSNPEKTAFNELDAATAWFMGRVSEKSPFKAGSSGSNLMNMSVLVYRNINLLAGSEEDSKSRIDRVLQEQELKLKELFSSLQKDVETKLAQQCGSYFDSPCWKGVTDVFSNKVARSFVKLGESINSLDIKPGLTGSINGKYKFNFLDKEFRR